MNWMPCGFFKQQDLNIDGWLAISNYWIIHFSQKFDFDNLAF